MFDLRAIRDNPEAFRAAWERKASGLGSNVDAILAQAPTLSAPKPHEKLLDCHG